MAGFVGHRTNRHDLVHRYTPDSPPTADWMAAGIRPPGIGWVSVDPRRHAAAYLSRTADRCSTARWVRDATRCPDCRTRHRPRAAGTPRRQSRHRHPPSWGCHPVRHCHSDSTPCPHQVRWKSRRAPRSGVHPSARSRDRDRPRNTPIPIAAILRSTSAGLAAVTPTEDVAVERDMLLREAAA